MKKLLCVLLALCVVFAFAACKKQPVSDPADDNVGSNSDGLVDGGVAGENGNEDSTPFDPSDDTGSGSGSGESGSGSGSGENGNGNSGSGENGNGNSGSGENGSGDTGSGESGDAGSGDNTPEKDDNLKQEDDNDGNKWGGIQGIK